MEASATRAGQARAYEGLDAVRCGGRPGHRGEGVVLGSGRAPFSVRMEHVMKSPCNTCSATEPEGDARAQSTGTCSSGACGCGGCGVSEPVQAPVQPQPERVGHRSWRVKGPREQLRAVARKISQLERLAKQCTFYERHEVVNPQGEIVHRSARGMPLVYRRGLGLVPVDPEDPFMDDGTGVSINTLWYLNDHRNYHRIVRCRRNPTGDGSAFEERPPRPQLPIQKADVQALLRDGQAFIPVFIHVRDQDQLPRIPSKARTGPTWRERGRADRFTPLRRRPIRERKQRRQAWAAPLREWLRSVGGDVGHHATVYCSVLSARVPQNCLEELVARDDVVRVAPRPTVRQLEEPVDPSCLYTSTHMHYTRNMMGSQRSGGRSRTRRPVLAAEFRDSTFMDVPYASSGRPHCDGQRLVLCACLHALGRQATIRQIEYQRCYDPRHSREIQCFPERINPSLALPTRSAR